MYNKSKTSEYKKIIKNTINKDSDFTRSDFEKYVKLKYNVKIYNSIYEFYSVQFNKDISTELDQYVDDFAMHIVKTTHKVFRCTNSKINDKRYNSTLVFYSYHGDEIIDIFIERSGVINDSDCLYLFIKNFRQALEI